MTLPFDSISSLILIFLASMRYLGLLSSLLFFSEASLPLPVKLWLSLILALASLPVMENFPADLNMLSSAVTLLLFSVREVLVGVVLGSLASFPLYALQMAGRFIGHQMGFAMAETMDPTSEQKVAVIGQMKYLLGTWLWFYLGGHLLVTQAVAESLKVMPVGTSMFSYFTLEGIEAWITGLFHLVAKMVLPYFGVLLLTEIGLGFMAKTMPQMNIFMLGFPIKVLLALFLMAVVAVLMVRNLLPIEMEKSLEIASGFMGG